MDIFKSSEIERIAESLELKKTTIGYLEESQLKNRVIKALEVSSVGYFEWCASMNHIAMSQYTLKYMFEQGEQPGSYFDCIMTIMDEDAQYTMFSALESISKGVAAFVELEVPLYSFLHQEKRVIKFFIQSEWTESDFIIYGTTQDVTQLNESINDLVASRSLLSQLVNSLPMPILYVNGAGNIEYANQAVEDVLGFDIKRWYGESFEDYVIAIEDMMNVSAKRVFGKDDYHTVYEISAEKRGKRFELMIDEIKIMNECNDLIGRVFIHTDITDNVEGIEQAKNVIKVNELLVHVGSLIDERARLKELYRVILRGILDVFTMAQSCCILLLDYNQNLYIEESIGYSEGYSESFRIPFDDSFAKTFLNGDYRRSVRINNIQEMYVDLFPNLNDEARGTQLESNITAPISIDGKLYGLISIDSPYKDGFDEIDLSLIDYLRGKIEISINRFTGLTKVIEKSHRDELTGLYNRRYFNELLETLISEAVMNNEGFCLVVMDMDGLKTTNDVVGHLAGDALLRNFAEVISCSLRADEVIARFGGDEFIGLFRCTDAVVVDEKLNSITSKLRNTPLYYEGKLINTEFSYGISVFPSDGEDAEKLISIADERMYTQKSGKR